MMFYPILAVSFFMKLIMLVWFLSSVILILVVLIQKGRGGGLSGAFGGGMASGLLGSKTGDFLTWVTIVVVGIFLFFAVILAKFYRPEVGDYGTGENVPVQSAPADQGDQMPAGQMPIEEMPAPADMNSEG